MRNPRVLCNIQATRPRACDSVSCYLHGRVASRHDLVRSRRDSKHNNYSEIPHVLCNVQATRPQAVSITYMTCTCMY